MKFLNKESFFVKHFDAHKFRGKNFFSDFRKDDKKNLLKFSKFCTKKKIPCRICNSKKIENKFLQISKKYFLCKCSNCGFIFPNIDCTRINNYENEIYNNYHESTLSINESKNKKYRNSKLIKERYNYCYYQNFKNNKKKVLEVGFGQADFLTYLKKKNIPCFGIEYNKALVDFAKNKNLKVSFGNMEKLQDNFYDLVVMFDVIEHFIDPVKKLKIIYKKLKKGGLLIFYTPNVESLGFELMKDKQNLIQPFYHLNFLSKQSLKKICKITNFEITKYETFGLDLIDFFFMKEKEDSFMYTKKLNKEISIIQSIVDQKSCANHMRVTLKK